MSDGKPVVQNIVSGVEARPGADAPVTSGDRLHTLAIYGALALIAAIVFGTLSYHPF